MFDTKRFIGGVLAATLLLVLPASALAARPQFGPDGFGPSASLRCSDAWQYVGYAVVVYIHEESVPAKEQLLHELAAGLQRAARDCRAV